jgi:hypothetical protein
MFIRDCQHINQIQNLSTGLLIPNQLNADRRICGNSSVQNATSKAYTQLLERVICISKTHDTYNVGMSRYSELQLS